MKYPNISEIRAIYQKPYIKKEVSFIHTFLNLYVASYLIKVFLYLKLKPNFITSSWIFLGILSPLLFLFNAYHLNILASILLIFVLVLDCTDGSVARITNTTSFEGDFLESFGHLFVEISVFSVLSISLFYQFNSILYPILGLLAIFSIIFFSLIHLEVIHLYIKHKSFLNFFEYQKSSLSNDPHRLSKLYAILISIYRSDLFVFLIFFFTLLNLLHIFFIIFVISYFFFTIFTFIYEYCRPKSWFHHFFKIADLIK